MRQQSTEPATAPAQHTPGPWRVERTLSCYEVRGPFPYVKVPLGKRGASRGMPARYVESDEQAANAALIAAAPELLAALGYAAAGYAALSTNESVPAFVREIARENFTAARAAIAKARG